MEAFQSLGIRCPRMTWRCAGVALAVWSTSLVTGTASAHGIVGKRFFPATLTIDDPFVADELSLPTYQQQKMPASGDEPATTERALSFDYTKRITPDFGIGVGGTYLSLSPEGGSNVKGWDNFALSAKYQFYQNTEHETIVSAGVDWDIGHSGSARVGAEPFSTVTPAISSAELRRLARERSVCGRSRRGQLGVSIPSRTPNPVNDEGDTATNGFEQLSFRWSTAFLSAIVRRTWVSAPPIA
jgi:hypothetical protein